MDAKQFLAEFGHIVNATGGVQKLRELVYNLAISGNLCQRNENEGEASELLEAITLEKNKRVKEKSFKRTPKFEKMEITLPNGFDLPRSWAWTNLVSIGEISPKNTADDDLECSFVPMTGVSQEHAGDLIVETRKWGKIKKGYTQLANGDVAIAKITPCFENGKSAVIEGLKNSIGAGTTELHVVRPLPGVNPKYIYIFLRSPYFRVEGELKMTGTAGQKRLSSDYFATRAFPLPPIEEQARIVEKVDELMSLCDKLEEQQQQKRQVQNQLRQASLRALAEASSPFELKQHWQRIYDHFGDLFSVPDDVQEFRNLVVDLAVSGKLTEKSSKADQLSVSGLLDSLEEMKVGKRFAKKSVPDEPFDVPLGWKWVLMEDLLKGSESGWSPKCHPEPRQNEQWGVLKVSAVTWGKFKPEENKCLPLSLDPRPETETLPGDFLLSRANTAELVARSIIVPHNAPKKLMMSDKIVRLQFLDERLKEWVNLANSSSYAREYYYQRATGTSDSMRNVSRQVMHELPVPILSIEQQENTLRKMDSFLELCSLLEKKIQQKVLLAEKIAITTIAKLVGVDTTQEEERLKTPKTELIAPVNLGNIKPSSKDDAPLATLLARQSGRMNASDLWQRFGGEIDAFYAQLKVEVAHGWIAEPETASMLEKDEE